MTLPVVAHSADAKGQVFGQVGAYSERGSGGQTNVLVGGGAAVRLLRRSDVFVEFNYVPVANVSSYGSSFSAKLIQAGGGVRIFVNPGGRLVRAFVPLLGGYIRASASASDPVYGVFYRANVNGFYAGTGLGVEIGPKRFGARPEIRYLREFVRNSSDANAITAMAGFYFRF